LRFLRQQPILRQVLGAFGFFSILLLIAAFYAGLRVRAERADEVQQEAGTVATTAVTLLNEYLSSLDAMALVLGRHPAVAGLNGPEASRLFAGILQDQPLLGNIVLRDSHETLVASAIPSGTANTQPQPIVGKVIRSGRPAATQLVYGPISKARTVFLAYPVKDGSGRLVGVLGFSLFLRNLESVFSKLPLPEGSVVVLADQSGLTMARSVDSEKYVGAPIDTPKTTFGYQLDADGVERFHGTAMIDRGPWQLNVAIPRSEVVRRLQAMWRRNILLVVFVTLLVLALTWWVAWHTVIDFGHLKRAAGRIASGDLSPVEAWPVLSRDMEELQVSFATMAEKLRQARETLDRQFAQERKMLEAVQQLQRQVVRQERLAAVGLLVSGIAHELNNPLQAILGTIEVVEREPNVPQEISADIAQVKAQSNRARDIIRNLSRFSRQKPGPPALVDLRDVISSVAQLRKRELDSAGIALDVETESVRTVLAAFAELEQVLLNFVMNAQQAIAGTGRRSGRILIRLKDAGKKLRLEVWDDGPGVPAQDEQKLFQPFFTTKPVGTGTGLGLSVSYGIVDAYGGATGYFRNEWGGATFFIELPAAEPGAGAHGTDDRAAVLHGRASTGV